MEHSLRSNQGKSFLWRIGFAIALFLVALAGCANEASITVGEPIMRLTLQMVGNLETSNPDIRYYVVLNTCTAADDPVASPSAEASASAGILPPSGGDPAGPRAYGPFLADYPKLGYDLPFYLSGGGPNDPRQTRSYTGTVPLLPVTWTDYFVLTSEFGSLQLIHAQHPHPASDPATILPNVATLQQGQDYFIDQNTLTILIRISSLVNGAAINSANDVTTDNPLSPAQGRIVTANFITSNTQGQIIDRWTLADNSYGVTLHTALTSMDQGNKTQPLLHPENKPSVVSDGSMNFAQYQSVIRQ